MAARVVETVDVSGTTMHAPPVAVVANVKKRSVEVGAALLMIA